MATENRGHTAFDCATIEIEDSFSPAFAKKMLISQDQPMHILTHNRSSSMEQQQIAHILYQQQY